MTLPDSLLQQAAFELLSSSTLARYTRVAHRLSPLARVVEQLDSGEVSAGSLRTWTLERWRFLLSAEERGRAEIELALVLPSISQMTDDWVHTLLRAMVTASHPGATWISGLARGLLRSRATNAFVSRPSSSFPTAAMPVTHETAEANWAVAPTWPTEHTSFSFVAE